MLTLKLEAAIARLIMTVKLLVVPARHWQAGFLFNPARWPGIPAGWRFCRAKGPASAVDEEVVVMLPPLSGAILGSESVHHPRAGRTWNSGIIPFLPVRVDEKHGRVAALLLDPWPGDADWLGNARIGLQLQLP